MVFRRELFTLELLDEAYPLIAAHYHEAEHFADIPFDLDDDFYLCAEAGGILRCFTARAGTVLVGYAVFFVRRNARQRSIQAAQDGLFLLPEYRRGIAGARLIRYAEKALAVEGVHVVYHYANLINSVGQLLQSLEYEHVGGIYAKRLNR